MTEFGLKKQSSGTVDAAWSAVCHFLVFAQGIVLLPIVIKVAGTVTYGTYNLVLSVLTIIYGISSFGAGYHARRSLPSAETGRARGELYAPQLLFQLSSLAVLATLFWLGKPLLDRTILFGGDSYSVGAAFLYLSGFCLFAQAGDYFRYGPSVKIYTVMSGVAPLLYVSAVVAAWQSKVAISVSMLLSVQGIVYLVCAAVAGSLAIRDSGPIRLRFSVESLLADIRIGHPLVLYFLVDTILSVSDRYLIALFLGVGAVGIYQPAYQLGALITFVGRIGAVVMPKFLSIHVDADRKERADALLERAFKAHLILGIPFVIGCAIMARPILVLLTTPEVAAEGWLIAPTVALGCVFYGLQMNFTNAAYVSGATQVIFLGNLIAALAKLGSTLCVLLLLPRLWICGITTLLAFFVAFLYTAKQLRPTWKLTAEPVFLAKIVGASMLMALWLVLLGWAKSDPAISSLNVGASLLSAIAVYFFALTMMGGVKSVIKLR